MQHNLRTLKKQFKKATYSAKTSLEELREEYEHIFYSPHIPNNVEILETEFKNIKADVLKPEIAVSGRTILYAHGGSFIAGSRKSYRNFCASFANESSSNLYLAEYRLSPEYPFPTALEDLYTVYAGLIETGKTVPHNLILAGDGAGGGLATALIHYLKNKKLPLPVCAVLISPWADLTGSNERINTKKDFVFSKESLSRSVKLYTYEKNAANELVSPLLGNFENFPRTFIQCGGDEILLSDAQALLQKIESAGGTAELHVYEKMPHLFQALPDTFAEAHLAVEELGQKINSLFCRKEEI